MELLNNGIVWLIFLLALFNYGLLVDFLLTPVRHRGREWRDSANQWLGTIKITLAALPLLGLLGTIVGLLNVFYRMSLSAMNQQELLSSGIADAMFTTEMGLVCVVPGLILHAIVLGRVSKTDMQT